MDMNTLEHVENIVLSLKPGEIHKSYKVILDELNKKLEKNEDPKSVITDQQLYLQKYFQMIRQQTSQIEFLKNQLLQSRRQCLVEE